MDRWRWWFVPVIPATWEAEAGGSQVAKLANLGNLARVWRGCAVLSGAKRPSVTCDPALPTIVRAVAVLGARLGKACATPAPRSSESLEGL
jgi:hypothetical protein